MSGGQKAAPLNKNCTINYYFSKVPRPDPQPAADPAPVCAHHGCTTPEPAKEFAKQAGSFRKCKSKRCSRPAAERRMRCQVCLDIKKKSGKKRRERPEVRAAQKAYNKERADSGKTAEYNALYYANLTEEYKKDQIVRTNARIAERRNTDPAYRLCGDLQKKASQLASGEIEKSPLFIKNTSFKSVKEYLDHLKLTVYDGFEWKDYGGKNGYQIDHRCPRSEYDHNNPEDIRRCWSAANMQILTAKQNRKKYKKLIRSELEIVQAAGCLPKSYDGKIPENAE